jgi:hypothetical protein
MQHLCPQCVWNPLKRSQTDRAQVLRQTQTLAGPAQVVRQSAGLCQCPLLTQLQLHWPAQHHAVEYKMPCLLPSQKQYQQPQQQQQQQIQVLVLPSVLLWCRL